MNSSCPKFIISFSTSSSSRTILPALDYDGLITLSAPLSRTLITTGVNRLGYRNLPYIHVYGAVMEKQAVTDVELYSEYLLAPVKGNKEFSMAEHTLHTPQCQYPVKSARKSSRNLLASKLSLIVRHGVRFSGPHQHRCINDDQRSSAIPP